MKRKAIEKIPYITLPNTIRDKDVEYIGVTAIKNIGHERHLLIEMYENRKNRIKTPAVRIVVTKKDFGNYFPESGEWTRQKIMTGYYGSDTLLWEGSANNNWERSRNREKRSVLLAEEDLKRIKTVCKERAYKESEWWKYIKIQEDRITRDERSGREERKYQRRQQALKEHMDNTEPLPEILDRANRIYMREKHFLYYKKRGHRVQIACSACGGVTDARWKSGISYESQFERWVEEPKEGRYGNCPLCRAEGEYKCQGKVKDSYSQGVNIYLGQKYKKSGVVMRYVEVTKRWHLDITCTDNGEEMLGAGEEIGGAEIARAYFEPDKNVQIDYHKHNPYAGVDFWDDKNLSEMGYIVIGGGWILPETWDNLQGTMFQYSGLREYTRRNHQVNAIQYLEHYMKTPQLEILAKLELDGVVKNLLSCQYGIVRDRSAKRLDTFLGIRKERTRQLIKKKGDAEFLRVCQMETALKAKWTDEQIEQISESALSARQIGVATQYMSIQQLLNRIAKYAGCRYGTRCGNATDYPRSVARTYMDYLEMRIKLGYDMTNTVYQQPRNLQNAHNKMVQEQNKKLADERLRRVKEGFPKIRKQYRTLRRKYFYEDENYIIRPARSAEEIVEEGRILHHCVGGDHYLGSHNDGESYILMLRHKKDPNIPYITIEINPENNRIRQWYGAHDKKPDEKNIQAWLDRYVTRLKCGATAAVRETALQEAI